MRKVTILTLVMLLLLVSCSRDPLKDAQTVSLEGYATLQMPQDWTCKLQDGSRLICQPPDATEAVFNVMPLTRIVPGGELNEIVLGKAVAEYWPSNLITGLSDIEATTVGGLSAFSRCVETQTGFRCCAAAAGQATRPVFIPYCAKSDQARKYERIFKAVLKAIEF